MINKNLKIALFSFAALLILSMIYLLFAFIFKLPPFYNEDFGAEPGDVAGLFMPPADLFMPPADLFMPPADLFVLPEGDILDKETCNHWKNVTCDVMIRSEVESSRIVNTDGTVCVLEGIDNSVTAPNAKSVILTGIGNSVKVNNANVYECGINNTISGVNNNRRPCTQHPNYYHCTNLLETPPSGAP